MIDKIRTVGWRAVEIAAVIVLLCVLLHIILGDNSGSFITGVALNATLFAQDIPAGVLLSIALIVVAYWFFKREKRG